MNRQDARALFQASGLDYTVLTKPNLRRLIRLIDDSMRSSGLIRGSFRMRRALGLRIRDGKPQGAYLRCRASYFENREAVSFGDDGFVGFAGWADDHNIQPVLDGFSRWCAEMRVNAGSLHPAATAI